MKRFKHTLSNYQLLTGNMGKLIPVGMQEALPGDTFQMSSSALIRVSPLAAPVMHPVDVRIHHYFVPHRLVWDEWEDFITGGPDGMDASTPPTITVPSAATYEKSLLDYIGVPPNAEGVAVSALPIRGLNAIWNEYYRDQDLQTERSEADITLPDICWGKDYFTAARPWTQKGADVTIPITGTLPVRTQATELVTGAQQALKWRKSSAGATVGAGGQRFTSTASGTFGVNVTGDATPTDPLYPTNLYADLSAGVLPSVNDFRRSFAIQRYQEARARYGSRYTEYLRYLGVSPSDARLQRPEFLGGGTSKLNFSEVLQTADATPGGTRESYGVGDMYGHGISGLRTGRVRRFIEEHGYIFTLLSVRPKGIYMTGIPRTLLRTTKEDFWQKELEFIGQQEVTMNEIYADSASGSDVFGYVDRYREYRECPSTVHAEYRDLLNYWHMARDLPDTTTLNADFVKCVPTTRVYNVTTNDVLWCLVNNHVVARRAVSKSAYARIL